MTRRPSYNYCSKCSCYHGEAYDCQKVKQPVSVGNVDSVLEREIWNKAIEAAASSIEGAPLFANKIKELKK